jgi:hypothetical protein
MHFNSKKLEQIDSLRSIAVLSVFSISFKFFQFNFKNIHNSETSFDLKKRFVLIFHLFNVPNIASFSSKISFIKKKANLEDDLNKLNININKSSENILKGINLLRLGNNPVKINRDDILKVMLN